ncbi:MAG: hypothetical protein ABR589_12130 [Chthoniobacterales bacterium]
MIARLLQLFFVLLLQLLAAATGEGDELEGGKVASLVFRDVDGNDLSTTAGHVTVITVITRRQEEQAQAVADQVPDRCMGDPKYRYVTLVNFQRKLPGPLQSLTRGIIRRRLDAEARELKPDYQARKLRRDPRKHIFVIADFDGRAVMRLGLSPESNAIAVFVFDGMGKLIERWIGVPPEGALAKAIAAAE